MFQSGVDVLLTPSSVSDAKTYKDFIVRDNRQQQEVEDVMFTSVNLAGGSPYVFRGADYIFSITLSIFRHQKGQGSHANATMVIFAPYSNSTCYEGRRHVLSHVPNRVHRLVSTLKIDITRALWSCFVAFSNMHIALCVHTM